MPLYEYKCKCGHTEDAHNSIEERNSNAPVHCDERMSIRIGASHHIAPVLGGGGFPGYQCPVEGKYVTSRKERREIMKRNNLEERG